MIEEDMEYINWAEEGSDSILIPNDKKFVAMALPNHFRKIKMESFEKQLRNYGYQKKKKIMASNSDLRISITVSLIPITVFR
ncbi:hypothetical protein FRC00_001726 [Tulasnella sp. 408]|nr:hypothetical protein FRC00_001726 [Tulasnella sp. 408]